MNKTINITVKDKIATAPKDAIYICGNSDFVINFDFDSEWDAFDTKTARFIHDGTYTDVVFQGNQCAMPIISNTYNIKVGVFAGNLHTTTPAYVPAKKSILCEGGSPEAPSDDVYNQIMELIQELGTTDPEAIAAAVAEYIAAHPIEEKDPTVPAWAKADKKPEYSAEEVGAIAKTELQTAINTALAQAKASGEFDGADGSPGADGKDGVDGQPGADGSPGKDGADGKDGVSCTHSWDGTVLTVTSASGTSSADLKGDAGEPGAPGAAGADGYTPVKGTDYFTEADKQEIAEAAAEKVSIPEALPNPNALTFTGAVTGSYDGSQPLTVNIPSGAGGDSPWRLIKTVTLEETVKSITVDTDKDGNAFSLSEIYINTNVTNSEDQTTATNFSINANGKSISYIGTYSPMAAPGGKTGESGRNWLWLMSLNPLRALHGTWLATNTASGKTVQCFQTNEFSATNPNPFSVGEKITSIIIESIGSTAYMSAGSEFRIYGR